MLAAALLGVVGLLALLVPYYELRRRAVAGPLLHVTTAAHVASIVAGVPDGWVRLRPGSRRMHRVPLIGWPPRPFGQRVCFYLGEQWPGRLRRRYNLAHPDECTHAVVVDVSDLATFGGRGRLYRRWIDASVAWSGEYQGPGRIVERTTTAPG